ncbi:uncharacterized protein PITG_02379 [Phytophthora infestans T30-4]|uniref:Uncharacterized protein n=1 Tax=Phytophthora infestans (strain T30-4) TaxID=403677 RepID=D0MW67_PHYIT|nr:uncharacterized protein PITG_02379 [Phytophthora infestans T30-4]EEY63880.1 conserved hypothetical protein [Phytophthora infestans T30-4]|eukprot:XP_002907316.1 conserved hypothetical protein [Phytophthora infestans T30-4]
MECIPQSADCTSEVLTKVKSFLKVSEAIQLGVKCGQKLFTATSSLQLLSLVNQSDLVVNELPAAVCTCLNIPDGTALLNPSNFLAFIKDLGVDDSVQKLDQDSLTQLQDVLTSGATCGTKLQTIIHKVTQFVIDAKSGNPATTISAIRQALSVSELFLSDIPAVTNNCVRNLTDDAFSTRDSLRTVVSTITDGLVEGSVDDDGKSISTVDYLAKVADMGLDVIAMFDPTGIAEMMSTFIQPICGPTAFMGEIDDGSLDDALALTTDGYVFKALTRKT